MWLSYYLNVHGQHLCSGTKLYTVKVGPGGPGGTRFLPFGPYVDHFLTNIAEFSYKSYIFFRRTQRLFSEILCLAAVAPQPRRTPATHLDLTHTNTMKLTLLYIQISKKGSNKKS